MLSTKAQVALAGLHGTSNAALYLLCSSAAAQTLNSKDRAGLYAALHYQAIHTAVLLCLTAVRRTIAASSTVSKMLDVSYLLLFTGSTLFSSTVCLKEFGKLNVKKLPIPPFAGLVMMVGWVTVMLSGMASL